MGKGALTRCSAVGRRAHCAVQQTVKDRHPPRDARRAIFPHGGNGAAHCAEVIAPHGLWTLASIHCIAGWAKAPERACGEFLRPIAPLPTLDNGEAAQRGQRRGQSGASGKAADAPLPTLGVHVRKA